MHVGRSPLDRGEPDTSATGHFGTTKLVHRVEVSRLFLDHGTRVEVSRTTFWRRSVLRSAPKCHSVLMPKCPIK